MISPTELLRITCHAVNNQITDGGLRRTLYHRLFKWADQEDDDFHEIVGTLMSEFDGDPAFASASDQVFSNVSEYDETDLTPEYFPEHEVLGEPNFA